nr:extracellular solute-binding protein [bacterium]
MKKNAWQREERKYWHPAIKSYCKGLVYLFPVVNMAAKEKGMVSRLAGRPSSPAHGQRDRQKGGIHMKKHQVMTAMVACGILLTARAGCAGPKTPAASATPTAEPSASASPTPGKDVRWPSNIDFGAMEGKTIKIYGSGDRDDTYLESTMPQYETLQEQFSGEFGVNFQYVHLTEAEIRRWPWNSEGNGIAILRYCTITGRSPTIIPTTRAVIYEDNWPMPRLAAMGLVQPIDQWIDEKDNTFIKSVMDANTWKGKRYCLQYYEGAGFPKGGNMLSVVYNLSEIKRRGLETPMDCWEHGEWTWEKLIDLSRKLTVKREDGTAKKYGFVYDEMAIGAAIAQSGSQVCKEKGDTYEVQLDDAHIATILQKFAQATAAEDIFYRPYQYGYFSRQALMAFHSWSVISSYWDGNEGKDIGQAAPLPSLSGGNEDTYCTLPMYFMIGKDAENPEAGFAWLWYRGNYYNDPQIGDWAGRNVLGDTEGRLHYSTFPPEVEKIKEVYIERILESGQVVTPDNYWGFPGVNKLFKQMCDELFDEGRMVSEVIERYQPQMQAAA